MDKRQSIFKKFTIKARSGEGDGSQTRYRQDTIYGNSVQFFAAKNRLYNTLIFKMRVLINEMTRNGEQIEA